jgi:hypothetical protein
MEKSEFENLKKIRLERATARMNYVYITAALIFFVAFFQVKMSFLFFFCSFLSIILLVINLLLTHPEKKLGHIMMEVFELLILALLHYLMYTKLFAEPMVYNIVISVFFGVIIVLALIRYPFLKK